jgi:hypothetical protein
MISPDVAQSGQAAAVAQGLHGGDHHRRPHLVALRLDDAHREVRRDGLDLPGGLGDQLVPMRQHQHLTVGATRLLGGHVVGAHVAEQHRFAAAGGQHQGWPAHAAVPGGV